MRNIPAPKPPNISSLRAGVDDLDRRRRPPLLEGWHAQCHAHALALRIVEQVGVWVDLVDHLWRKSGKKEGKKMSKIDLSLTLRFPLPPAQTRGSPALAHLLQVPALVWGVCAEDLVVLQHDGLHKVLPLLFQILTELEGAGHGLLVARLVPLQLLNGGLVVLEGRKVSIGIGEKSIHGTNPSALGHGLLELVALGLQLGQLV